MKKTRIVLMYCLPLVIVSLCITCNKKENPVYEEKKIIAEKLLDSMRILFIQDPAYVITLSDSVLKIADELNDDYLKAYALTEKGGAYIYLGNTSAFDSCLNAALNLKFKGCEVLHADIHTSLADNYNFQGNHPEGLQHAQKADSIINLVECNHNTYLIQYKISLIKGFSFFELHQNDSMQFYMDKALNLAKELKDENNFLFVYSYLGYFYSQLSDFSAAEKNLLEAYKWSKKANNYDALSATLVALSNTAIGQKKYDKSIEYCQKALQIDSEQMKIESKMPYIYANLAESYYYKNEYFEALKNAKNSLSYPQSDTMQMAATYAILSQIYIKMEDYVAALNNAQLALNYLGENSTDLVKKEVIYNTISNSYEKLSDYNNAHKYAKLSYIARDSINSKERFSAVHELQTKYETEKKDLVIKAANLTIETQKQRGKWITLIFTLLSAIFVLYFYYNRKILNKQILLAEQGNAVAKLKSKTLTPNCGNDNGNGLSEEKTNEILHKLRICMEDKKMFKNPALTLDILANEIETNRSYLSIVINSRMQKGFTEYVNFYRVEEAKKLLRDTDNKISYILVESGFGSPQSFYSIFKSVVQLTPTQYRKTQRKH
jgi:AraC-like DNA-binding protein